MIDRSDWERRDICALAENIVVFEIAIAFLERLGGGRLLEAGSAYGVFLSAECSIGRDR